MAGSFDDTFTESVQALQEWLQFLEDKETELRGKLEELKKGLSPDHIEFNYVFDNNLHDRWIETDTGWRIILGRGLDIFQKPEDKFTLGFLDQTKRKCKATTITYTRVKTPHHNT